MAGPRQDRRIRQAVEQTIAGHLAVRQQDRLDGPTSSYEAILAKEKTGQE